MLSPDSPLHRTGEDRAVLVVTGKDRLSWLNGLVTCDLSKSSDEHYGLVLEKKGKIVTDFYWLSGAESLYLLVPAKLADDVVKLLEHHLIMEDAEIARLPLVPHWIYGLSADFVLPEGKPGAKLLLRGVGRADALRASVILEPPDTPKDGGLTPEGWDALRQEHAIPLFGVDFDATIYPQEAAIEGFAVSFEKGCYLGQEVVYMQKHRGQARRRLVSLRLEGEALPVRGARVLDPSGADVGEVTSASLAAGAVRAIALVKTAAGKEGAAVTVGSIPAVIV
jgi:folate-binding protein YgfZ